MSRGDDENEEYMGDKLVAPADFQGPSTKERKCTDLLCTLLVVVMWCVMTFVGVYAVRRGDYRVVLYPMDYSGNICGIDYNGTDMTSYPKLLYINNMAGGVCVKSCPSITDIYTLVTYDGVWQDPNNSTATNTTLDFVKMANYSSAANSKSCQTSQCTTDPTTSWTSSAINKGYGFAFYAVKTFSILGNTRCLADPLALKQVREQVHIPDDNILNLQALDTSKDIMRNFYSDLYIARNYLMITFAVAMVRTHIRSYIFIYHFVYYCRSFYFFKLFIFLNFKKIKSHVLFYSFHFIHVYSLPFHHSILIQ